MTDLKNPRHAEVDGLVRRYDRLQKKIFEKRATRREITEANMLLDAIYDAMPDDEFCDFFHGEGEWEREVYLNATMPQS